MTTAALQDIRIDARPYGRRGAEARTDEIQFSIVDSTLGTVLVAASDRGLRAALLGDDRSAVERELHDRFPGAALVEAPGRLAELAAAFIRMIDSPADAAEIPLDLRGTDFQLSVWQVLREIPAGETATYTEIAKRIGRPRAVRAVGSACAANPLAVVIPCHRAVRSDGSLAGYRWGLERKRRLLEIESANWLPHR